MVKNSFVNTEAEFFTTLLINMIDIISLFRCIGTISALEENVMSKGQEGGHNRCIGFFSLFL